jgi:hypothetical protein
MFLTKYDKKNVERITTLENGTVNENKKYNFQKLLIK